MATVAPSAATRWNWRTIAFTTLVALFGLQTLLSTARSSTAR